MLFNSIDFAIFLPVVFILYWFLTNRNLKLQNESIISGLADASHFKTYLKPDEAGREFDRVAISAATEQFSIRDLVQFLSEGKPGIRTRNHHLDQGYILIDPRELMSGDPELIVKRLLQFSP